MMFVIFGFHTQKKEDKTKETNYNFLDYNLLISISFFFIIIFRDWARERKKKYRANRDHYNKSWIFSALLFTIIVLLWRESFLHFFVYASSLTNWPGWNGTRASLWYYYGTFLFPTSNGFSSFLIHYSF